MKIIGFVNTILLILSIIYGLVNHTYIGVVLYIAFSFVLSIILYGHFLKMVNSNYNTFDKWLIFFITLVYFPYFLIIADD